MAPPARLGVSLVGARNTWRICLQWLMQVLHARTVPNLVPHSTLLSPVARDTDAGTDDRRPRLARYAIGVPVVAPGRHRCVDPRLRPARAIRRGARLAPAAAARLSGARVQSVGL